jgi:hypothetical protein
MPLRKTGASQYHNDELCRGVLQSTSVSIEGVNLACLYNSILEAINRVRDGDVHAPFNANQLTFKQLDSAFISGSNIPAGGSGSGGGGISASFVEALTTSLVSCCFVVLFETSFAIEALRGARGFGGMILGWKLVFPIWQRGNLAKV